MHNEEVQLKLLINNIKFKSIDIAIAIFDCKISLIVFWIFELLNQMTIMDTTQLYYFSNYRYFCYVYINCVSKIITLIIGLSHIERGTNPKSPVTFSSFHK